MEFDLLAYCGGAFDAVGSPRSAVEFPLLADG